MRIKLIGCVLAASLAGGLFADALHSVYRNPGYVCGIWNMNADTGMSKVPTTPTLAGPGLALADFLDVTHWAFAGTGAMSYRGEARGYITHPYYDGNGELQFIIATVQKWDDKYIKGAVYKFTQGADGVYVQQIATPYKQTDSKNLSTWDFVNVAADGTITYNWTNNGSYNFYSYNAMKWVPTAAPALMFKNAEGEPVLTVADIQDYRFTAVQGGGSMNPVKYTTIQAQNKHVILDGEGNVEKLILEMQVMDDKYLKCAVIALTNGDGGVYAQNVAGVYVNATAGGYSLGYEFLYEDGSVNNESNKIGGGYGYYMADSPWASGYGMAGLTATATTGMTLNLDASKTWSELVGSTEPIDDAQMDIVVNVTAADAVLTFDVPLTANSLIIKSSGGNPITFALAEGAAAPAVALWDTRNTTGDVTFTGFTPVTDAKTDNILPNAASTLAFYGDTQGFMPFSEVAVTVPCKAVVVGTGVTLGNFTLNKLGTVTFDGDVVLTGAVTGTGTILLNGDLVVGGAVSLASTVTVSTSGGTIAARAVGEGPNSLVATADQFTKGALVLTEGTLTATAGTPAESYPPIGNGATLALVVDAVRIHTGYTSVAQLQVGGTLRFYDAAGEEQGIDRPEMLVLPPLDAVWTPQTEGDNTLATDANWSTGETPAEGDVTLADGGFAGATATLATDQTFATVSVARNMSVTLAANGGTLTCTTLALAEGATLAVPLAAVTFGSAELAEGSTLVLVGDETEREFTAPVSGSGRVVYEGGKFLVTGARTYWGGTTIRGGAEVKSNARRTTVDGIVCCCYGKTWTHITIEAGSCLDENGCYDMNYYVTAAGDGVEREDGTFSGVLFNSAGDCGDGQSQFVGLTLTADASIRLDEGHTMAFLAPGYGTAIALNLGEYTLTKVGAGTLYVKSSKPMTFTGAGKVVVAEGELRVARSDDTTFTAANATIETRPGGTFTVAVNATVNKVLNDGILRFDTPGYDIKLSPTTFEGTGTVRKTGVGFSAWSPFNNGCKMTYLVEAGRLCPLAGKITMVAGAPYAFNTEEEPNLNQKVVVYPGAQFDLDGVNDVTLNVVVSGRLSTTVGSGTAFTNRSTTNVDANKMQTVQLTAASEAWIGGANGSLGILGPGYKPTLLDLGTNTIHLAANAERSFWLCNTSVTGTGCFSVESGTAVVMKNTLTGPDWTLAVGETGVVKFDNFGVVCSNLVFRGSTTGSGTITAMGTYLPGATETLPPVLLTGPGAGIDVSEFEEPWALETGAGLTFAPQTRVVVRTGARELKIGDQLLAWSTYPTNVEAWTIDTPQDLRGMKVSARGDGLYLVPTAFSIIFC